MKFSEMKYERPDLEKSMPKRWPPPRAAKNWYSFTAKKTP